MLMPNVSFFKDSFVTEPKENIEFDDYLNGIKSGRWEDYVLNYRSGKVKKVQTPSVMPSCVVANGKSLENVTAHSGFLCLDIDGKQNEGMSIPDMRDVIYTDQYTYAAHLSLSGQGLAVYVKIDPKKHLEAYLYLEKYYANTYQVSLDPACKNINRLRYVCFDPELYINKSAKKLTTYLEKAKTPPRNYNDYMALDSDFDFVMKQITSENVNIAEDYHSWLKIGFALASKFGKDGLKYFHDISKYSSKYNHDDCEKKYNNILSSNYNKTSINTFYYYAQCAGVNIKSNATKKIEQVARVRLKQVGRSGGLESKHEAIKSAKKYLKETEGIEGEDVNKLLEDYMQVPDRDLTKKGDKITQVDTCIQIINQKGIRFNVITGKLEANKSPLTDNDLNSVFLDCMEVDETIPKDLFSTVIYSDRVKKFDPFQEFIEKNKHLRPKGKIQLILDSLQDDMRYLDNSKISDYKDVYVYKWLLSIMASIHGTYSLMILVLTGKQMIEKTNFFRNLLPDDLSSYYAESKLDAGKDDEILMTQKLIIVDDEFGGKSKQEAKKLKDLSSKQYFSIRRPYGKVPEDIRRIAVLGGTSNDDEILNDPTGNRRIIPLRITGVDKAIYNSIDKTELFMEIYHEWKAKGNEWMLNADEVKILNDSTLKHEQEILEEQLVLQYYQPDHSYSFEITSTKIKVYLENETNQRLSLYKIGQSLNKMGLKRKSIKRDGQVLQVFPVRNK